MWGFLHAWKSAAVSQPEIRTVILSEAKDLCISPPDANPLSS